MAEKLVLTHNAIFPYDNPNNCISSMDRYRQLLNDFEFREKHSIDKLLLMLEMPEKLELGKVSVPISIQRGNDHFCVVLPQSYFAFTDGGVEFLREFIRKSAVDGDHAPYLFRCALMLPSL